MVYNELRQVFIGVVLLVFGIVGGICQAGDPVETVTETSPSAVIIDSVIVEGYQGKHLSSLCVSGGDENRVPERINAQEYSLRIMGMVTQKQDYTYDEMLDFKHYRKVITLKSDTWSDTVELEGVLVSDLIEKAGVLPEATGISFRASDEYEASFSLNHISGNQIILAYRINGKPLTSEGGYPFILAAESARGQDWVKWVTEIEILSD